MNHVPLLSLQMSPTRTARNPRSSIPQKRGFLVNNARFLAGCLTRESRRRPSSPDAYRGSLLVASMRRVRISSIDPLGSAAVTALDQQLRQTPGPAFCCLNLREGNQ